MVFIQSTKTAQKNFQAVLVGQTKSQPQILHDF